MTPQFVDISQWQSVAIDWDKYKAWASQWDGISRVAMRSSYGFGYEDSNFDANRAAALAAGIDVMIFYHYAYPQYNGPQAEANWQAQVLGVMAPQDMIALDFEENTPAATAEWARDWLYAQEVNTGKLPRIYASSAYIAEHLQ